MKLEIEFIPFESADLSDLHNAAGVYAIFSENDGLQYIGSGDILSRLARHQASYNSDWIGCYSILNDHEIKPTKAQKLARVVEGVLLFGCREAEGLPRDNEKVDNISCVRDLIRKESRLEIQITGASPIDLTEGDWTIVITDSDGTLKLDDPDGLFVEKIRSATHNLPSEKVPTNSIPASLVFSHIPIEIDTWVKQSNSETEFVDRIMTYVDQRSLREIRNRKLIWIGHDPVLRMFGVNGPAVSDSSLRFAAQQLWTRNRGRKAA